ncbi:phage terminase, small subunit [Jeotgalibacillus soli]|uniref:Phage terminase, small subunit n=1 Tax=Jeotgalibacillus soli TaxID=889306 RepID=A0A0C2RVF7_9BACL|nr:phage terminase, small subunit [Jeotgalibacillus soli]
MLKKVEISARIEELKKTRADRLNLDAYWVLKRLMDISDRSMQAEPVLEWDPVEKMMVETGEYQFDSNGANRSTELIGKHLGMFKDNNNLNVNVGVQIVDDIPDDDDDE